MKETTATTPDKTGAACMQNHNNEQPGDYTTCKEINIPNNTDSKNSLKSQWLGITQEAPNNVDSGDINEVYKVAKHLGPYKPRALPSVQMEDGNLAANSQQETERWEAYFVEILIGELLEHVPVPEKCDTPLPEDLAEVLTVIDLSVNKNGDILKRLARGRSTGPGDFPTEVMQTGG